MNLARQEIVHFVSPDKPMMTKMLMLMLLQQQTEQRREFLDQQHQRDVRMREAEVLQVKRRPSLLSSDQYQHAHPSHSQIDR